MKKKIYILLLFMFLLFPLGVCAEGYVSVSDTSLTIIKGNSKNFTITAYNSIGDVTIKSKDTNVATVSTGMWSTGAVGDGQTKKGNITVTGVNVGTTTIELVIDAVSFDENDLRGTKTIVVNVIEAPVDNRSSNNNLKSINVDGYQLVKVNNNNYTLTVSNDVTSINVNALAEDEKASISGNGTHGLNIGENIITVVVTAENGAKNNIIVTIIRKDGYYLDDLETLLNDNNVTELGITINSDTKISNSELEKIKNSKKLVKFNYFDESKKLLYGWIIDGSKLSDLNEFVTSMSFISENKEQISSLSNYADGMYLNFKHEGKLPGSTRIKVYVGEKFNNNDLLNVYHYSLNSLDLISNQLMVVDGYIEFDIEHCSEYFVTRSILNKTNDNVIIDNENSIELSWILVGVEFIVIIIILLFKRKNNSKVVIQNASEKLFETESDVFPVINANTPNVNSVSNLNDDVPISNNINDIK